MPKFFYEAKKGPKEIVKGTVAADSPEQAVDKLNQMGYVPIRVVPAEKEAAYKQAPISTSTRRTRPSGLFRKVRSKELTVFTEQLASLVKSKLPLLEAMTILGEQTENAHLKKIILDVQREVRDGRTLSQAIGKYPDVFPPLYINMIESGEVGGVLDKTLMRLVDFRNKEEEIRVKVSTALAYPAFIVVVGIATVFVLLGFVIPRMTALFEEIGQSLPLPTMILVSMSNFIKDYWLLVLVAAGLLIFTLKRQSTEGKSKIIFDRMKLKLPLIGDFVKKHILTRFSRTLAILLANGIPLFQAIKITIPTLDNEVFKVELQSVRKNIIDGMSLEQSLKKSLWFPRFMTNMLAVGEKGGNLEEVLLEVASFYERDVDKTTKIMTSLLEPAIILVMGLIVGFIVFAMLLPIFEINLGM